MFLQLQAALHVLSLAACCLLCTFGGRPSLLSTVFGNSVQAGYAVIFLNRRHSIQPFTKGLPSGEIMDTLTDVLDCNGGTTMKVSRYPKP